MKRCTLFVTILCISISILYAGGSKESSGGKKNMWNRNPLENLK